MTLTGDAEVPENGRMDGLGSADNILVEGFRLDCRGGCLFRLDRQGEAAPVALGSRTVNLLRLLVERRGQLVSKDEIIETVWAGRVVEESNLNVHIAKLRRILDANREQGSCIQTVPGRGYCFIGSVKQPERDGRSTVPPMPQGAALAQPRLSILTDRDATSAESAVRDPFASSMQAATGRLRTTPMDLAGWLRGLGLEQYESAFRGNNIDREVLRRITGEDLRELGVASIGHRGRLLDAIAALPDRQQAAEASSAPSPAPPSPAPHAAAEGAERRQLTVMFCDLVGSAALSTRVDPEDLSEVIGAYHCCIADTVGRFAGCVAKHMGDGCRSISAIRKRTKMTPSRRCGPGSP